MSYPYKSVCVCCEVSQEATISKNIKALVWVSSSLQEWHIE